ncbi:MAG: hypothetical protein MJ252_02600 [archaeon]|nr:hypothetical protein [archaeon]
MLMKNKRQRDENEDCLEDNLIEDVPDNFDYSQIKVPNSNKPLWIPEVKSIVETCYPSSFNFNEIEDMKELISPEFDENYSITDYPYFNSIKKIMYSFGDTSEPNQVSVKVMHDFMKEFIINFSKIITECDFKKIVEHFFTFEYEKMHNYKKMKLSHKLLDGNISSKVKEEDEEEDIQKGIIITEKDFEGEGGDSENEDKENLSQPAFYEENAIFQNERTEQMSYKQYCEYSSCRQHNLLTPGKKHFFTYIQRLLNNNVPVELKEFSNVELLAFILKEKMRRIITEAIKEMHPQKKLFIITYPLYPEQLEPICEKEIKTLTEFLEDYYNDLSLINQFRKRKYNTSTDLFNLHSNKNTNKNIKIKREEDGETTIIIKKFALIDDEDESEYIKSVKRQSEVQVSTALTIMHNKILEFRNHKSRLEKIQKCATLTRSTALPKTNLPEVVDLKYWINELAIDNYYEFFLIQDYLFEFNLKDISIQQLSSKGKIIDKVSKKIITNKFSEFLKLNKMEREYIKKKFNNLIGKEENGTSLRVCIKLNA